MCVKHLGHVLSGNTGVLLPFKGESRDINAMKILAYHYRLYFICHFDDSLIKDTEIVKQDNYFFYYQYQIGKVYF